MKSKDLKKRMTRRGFVWVMEQVLIDLFPFQKKNSK